MIEVIHVMRLGLRSLTASRWTAAVAAVLVAGGCAAFAAGEAAPKTTGILRVRFGGDGAETRIVVDLDRAVSAKVSADDPSRLVISLPNVGASEVLQGRQQGVVRAWTVANGAGGARLSLDLPRGATIKRRFLLPPGDGVANYRYVIDVAGAAPAAPQSRVVSNRSSGPAPTAVIPAAAPADDAIADLADRPNLGLKKVVVIDAGHGGHDPGAQGTDASEKDITLAAARALKARLERGGRYQVVMTRDSDVYVPLETRVQIARKAGADLFISLHADSAGDNANPHGASVYTLSDRGGERVGRVITRNDWFVRTGARASDPAVGQILLDLTQRTTRNRSVVFAQLVVDRVGRQVEMVQNSHRDAGYFVLLAPDVPAALLEMGFITNSDDASRLTDPDQRGRLMDAVADSIDAYFSQQTRLAAR